MTRFVVTVIAAAALAAGVSSNALASDGPLGRDVSACAQTSLGQRVDPPAVTCTHDGESMSFPNFGAMVAHMRGS